MELQAADKFNGCSECGAGGVATVRLNLDDYHSGTYCESCLKKAVALFPAPVEQPATPSRCNTCRGCAAPMHCKEPRMTLLCRHPPGHACEICRAPGWMQSGGMRA